MSSTSNVVIAIRGTEGIAEWMHDAAFLQKPCPFLVGAGNTEDGFTTVYETLSIDSALTTGLTGALATLPFSKPIASLVICGHSLGGALATLLALDVVSNTNFKPSVYSYASPRTGDMLFASRYNQLVPNTFRIANQLDLVPKLPLEHPVPPLPEYLHVGNLISLNPFTADSPMKVAMTLRCEHILNDYQYLLTRLSGVTIAAALLPKIEPTCELGVAGLPLLVS